MSSPYLPKRVELCVSPLSDEWSDNRKPDGYLKVDDEVSQFLAPSSRNTGNSRRYRKRNGEGGNRERVRAN